MKVSWDDKIPNIYIYVESHKIPWFQTTNQIPNDEVTKFSKNSLLGHVDTPGLSSRIAIHQIATIHIPLQYPS